MDPLATIKGLLEAVLENDRCAVVDHAEALANWLNRGGFMPDADELRLALYDIAESRR